MWFKSTNLMKIAEQSDNSSHPGPALKRRGGAARWSMSLNPSNEQRVTASAIINNYG